MRRRRLSGTSLFSPTIPVICLASALWLTGCPEPGGGDSISKGDAEVEGGEGSDAESQNDATGSGLDGQVLDAARPPEPDAKVEPVPDLGQVDGEVAEPDAAVPEPDMAAEGECKPDETRPCEGCAQGTQGCEDGQWGECVGSAETCNGLDDNCDGNIDEPFAALGQPCAAGVGECESEGVVVCGPDGDSVLCGATAGMPSIEICDGLDNDCNGEVDVDPRGNPLGEPCYSGPDGTEGIGVCRSGGALCNADGEPGACGNEVVPTVEICDGLDNDCNGVVDDGPGGGALVSACYEGPDDSLNLGLCQAGVRQCEGGFVGPCEGQILPAEEICDSLDNDCDGIDDNPPDRNGMPQSCACEPGEVQACYGGPEGTSGVGICVAGRQTCLPDGTSFGICDGQILPQLEVCDGIDNDCTGVVDDNVAGSGAVCSLGVGGCSRVGSTVCDPMAFVLACDAAPGEPGVEICNDVDDNCDGRTDEDFPLGDRCALGDGQCLSQGALVCDAEGGVYCDAVAADPSDEVCDDLDNDCDGAVDNGFPLGESCNVGVGACAATGGLVCAADGGTTCGAEPLPAGVELCNGLDDDCDGVNDNDPESVGDACDSLQPGACAAGTQACAEGGLVCVPTLQPAPETCDGVDNDCDGVTDEDEGGALLVQGCYSGPLDSSGVGLCRAGLQTCRGGAFGPCEGQVVPGLEVCDSDDNDCDGEVDNLAQGECACEPGSADDCYTGPLPTQGIGVCHDGRWACNPDGLAYGACEGQVTPSAEACDGADNDCDGAVDDAVPGTGVACSAGVGECVAQGVRVCDAAAGQVVCNARAGAPRNETCDNRDNDCDGTVDDGLGLGVACSVGVGVCVRSGVQICNMQGGVSCSVQPGNAVLETCNNLDDDCDGTVDDGLNLGAECTVGVGACLRTGRNICGANGAVVCSVQAGQASPETCDGIDNNCNGQTDEGNPGAGGACNTGLLGVCSQGVQACVQGALRCQQSVQSSAEVCDGRDNNCNGSNDENAAGAPLSQACYSGPAGTQNRGVCRGGNQTCQAGAFGACVGQVLPAPADLCDGLDNNCNGTVDEQPGGGMCACLPGSMRACYSGAAGTQGVGICRAGTQTCNGDGLAWGACAGEVLPAAEVCDSTDNNCNGTVDDAPTVGNACTAGQGQCLNRGNNRCNVVTRQVECSVVAGMPSPEICDGLDNNCNGTNDDVVGVGGACTNGVGVCLRSGTNQCDIPRRALVCNAVAGNPSNEICDGLDNNCNGSNDDGQLPGVGAACSAGVGQCLVSGAVACTGGALACGAVAGQPRAETCDNVDNDCNGVIDNNPSDAGQICTSGVGACARQGVTVCNGQISCNAVPGAPSVEICDNADNDCDAGTDEQLDCNIYKSCLDARIRGAAQANAIYRLQPQAGGPVSNLFCDQVTDNGGWTLVGSTAGQALDDAQGPWHADLMTLAPAAANPGIWNGLANLSERFDLRFACRASLAAPGAPMDVDLSFYRTAWYREFVAGNDAASCFSEANMQDFPAPPRRDNRTGDYRSRRDQWDSGSFVGEDACGDVSDFTVDFDDRGMNGTQGDGTDWGEDDGALKCGTNGIATGQWFLYARERTRVAVTGPSSVTPTLRAQGYAAVDVPMDANLPTALNPDVFETVMIGRYSFNWPSIPAANQAALRSFSTAGGNVVTEYEGAAIFGSSISGSFQYAAGAPRPLNLFRYTTNGGGMLATGTPMAHAAPGDGLLAGLPNPFNFGGGGEFFTTLQVSGGEGPIYITNVATFAGNGTAGFPQGTWPAIARGRRCGGNFVFANFDYSDDSANPGVVQLMKNALDQSFLPPLSANEDTCRDASRPNLMYCGTSQRNVGSFLRGGQVLAVQNACAPTNDTQALLITRDGAANITPAALQGYLSAGGIVMTEWSAGDEIFNKVFGTAVVAGAFVGDCQDNVQPAVQYSPLDGFWEDNRFEPVAAGNTGCGYDMAGWPGIVPLGGPAAGQVTLAYRDYLGRGRLYIVESDWQDTQPAFSAQSAGLMHYMITHGAGGPLNFNGPEVNRALSTVQAQGFTTCFTTPYNSSVPIANVTAACNQGVLMMGCRQVGNNTLVASAMGNYSDVFFGVGNGANAVHAANQVDWYYDLASSWGFAPQGLGVSRNSCDTGNTSPEQRLCWHTGNNGLTGGYRCGATLNLNGSAAWERIVLQRRGSL